ncbi:MAG: preprotein translocase subunit SecE [Schaedlerella sp.]|nr:preprotein translocase subunit SecE [Lachnospiraceae bacterium]MDY4201948.1 preprotein translocase subunit SecE [Schaedlerella sp.]
MGENTEKKEKSQDKAPKKSWFKGLKAEFKKVVWPDKDALAKQTAAVVAVSVLLGAIISVIDTILKVGIDFLVR